MIQRHEVTHLCGAPIVLNMLIHAPKSVRRSFEHTVEVATGGAAPPSQVIQSMEEMGFRVTHLYGLTETYGPATVCAWQREWEALAAEPRTRLMARQGVGYTTLEDIMIAESTTMQPMPSDGESMGELMLRGNTVMKGYLKNPTATDEAFRGGWFHTGDLGVRHPDGYVEIKDRAKDVIITGGENVSSLEVEETLYKHPQIMEAAVVARPDDRWGETPCAFVTLTEDAGEVADEEIIAWCKERMAGFKVPKTIVFGPCQRPRRARSRSSLYAREPSSSLESKPDPVLFGIDTLCLLLVNPAYGRLLGPTLYLAHQRATDNKRAA